MPSSEIILDIRLWKVLLGVLLVVFAFFVYRRTFPQLPARRRILLGVLRAAAFTLLVLFVLDPSLVSVVMDESRPLVLALVDVSASMSITDCNGRSRLECSVGGLGILEEALRGRQDVDLEVIPFSSALWNGGVDPDSLPAAEGEGTDIAGALRKAQAVLRYRNLRGVVLLTDGRVTRGMLTSMTTPGIPVFPVGVGDTLPDADVSIEDVLFERVNYVGTSARAEVVLSVPGFGGRTITVRLMEGEKQLDRVEVKPGGGAAEVGAVLRYVPDKEGMKRLMVEVVPLSGEASAENNTEFFRVRVLREKIRILYIDELADWNFTFLRDIVERSERMDLESVVWKPDRGFVTLPGDDGFGFPSGPGGLKRYDLVIVSDGTRIFADRANTAALAAYVERGGGLLLLADEHSPLSAPLIFRDLERILPVTGQPSIELGEYHVGVAEVGLDHPLAIAFGESSDPPPLLARTGGLQVTSAAAVPIVMSDREGAYPFLALQRSGEGIAAVVLGFPLWRWRLAGQNGGATYVNFLGGLVQYLAEGGEVPVLTVETSRTAYRKGELVSVTAYKRDGRPDETIRGEIYKIDEGGSPVRIFLFEPDIEGRSYVKAEVGPLEPGDYRVAVAEIGDEGVGPEDQAEFSVLPVSVEFLDRSRDDAFLEYIASLSGGRVVELDSIGMLPRLLDLEPIVRERKEIDELRASPLLLAATVLLLTLEWVLRKFWGLV